MDTTGTYSARDLITAIQNAESNRLSIQNHFIKRFNSEKNKEKQEEIVDEASRAITGKDLITAIQKGETDGVPFFDALLKKCNEPQ